MISTAFDFTGKTDADLIDMIENLETTPVDSDEEVASFYAGLLAATRQELRRRTVRTYRIIVMDPANIADEYVNDYLWDGTKAEFAREYGLTGKHNPHRDHGSVTLPNGYRMHWGVQ